MGILIKGMKMPKKDELLCIRIYPGGKVTIDMDLQCKQVAEAVEVLNHGDLIDRNVLLSKVQKWYWEALETVKRMPAVIPADRK